MYRHYAAAVPNSREPPGGAAFFRKRTEADGNIVNIDSFSRILRSACLRKTQERRRTFRAP